MTLRKSLMATALWLSLAACTGQWPTPSSPDTNVAPLGVLPSISIPAGADPLAPATLLAIADYAGPMPSYAQGRAEALYRWAAPREACLKYFQCTCGCEGEGHKSNWNCYVKEVRADGVIVWDPMSAG